MSLQGNEVLEYLYQFENYLVSPIWQGEKAFPFLTMPHVDFCEAMGFESYQASKIVRMIKPNSIKSEEHLQQIIEERYFNYNYFEKELEQLELLKREGKKIGGGCFGPLTVASNILGAENILYDIVKRPQMVQRLLEYITQFMVELAKIEVNEGADFFWIAEPFISLLHPKRCWEFSGKYLRKIYDSVEVPGFLHVCGKTLYHTKYLEKTGAQVLSIDSMTDMKTCLRMVSENTVIMGNINPSTLWLEDASTIKKEIKKLLTECKNYKNLILSTGCSVMEGTPQENVELLFSVVEENVGYSNKEFRDLRNLISLYGFPVEFNSYIEENNVNEMLVKEAISEAKLIEESKAKGRYNE